MHQIIHKPSLYPGNVLCIGSTFVRHLIQHDMDDIVPVQMLLQPVIGGYVKILENRPAVRSLPEIGCNHIGNDRFAEAARSGNAYIFVVFSSFWYRRVLCRCSLANARCVVFNQRNQILDNLGFIDKICGRCSFPE